MYSIGRVDILKIEYLIKILKYFKKYIVIWEYEKCFDESKFIFFSIFFFKFLIYIEFLNCFLREFVILLKLYINFVFELERERVRIWGGVEWVNWIIFFNIFIEV